jgi:D-alanyl-D-alanine carboxypeptidase/D-alanyl-D-alanine-endopeptidase (penicillin-binding protein 4)
MNLRNFFSIAVLLLFLQACSTLNTTRQTSPGTLTGRAQLQSQIDGILDDSVFAPSLIGVKIVSLDDGKVLYSRNSNKLFHPASNMKLLTTSTAVSLLDKDFRFTTRIYADREARDSILSGNLYVKGCGDPLTTTADLDSVAVSIKQLGIREITGNLVGNVTYFDDIPWGAGWMWDDEPDAYAAFITPLTVNENAVHLTVRPGKANGDSLSFSVEPQTHYVPVTNYGVTSSDTTLPGLSPTRRKDDTTIIIRGHMKPGDPEQQFDISVWKPEMYFLDLLKTALNRNGVEVDGGVRVDTAIGKFRITEFSHPVDSVVHRINKMSDNLAAENLLKTLSAEKQGTPGSAAAGLNIVKEYLSRIGIDTTKMNLADGSGLSFYNLVSPDIIVQILRSQYSNPSTFKRFYESLPVGGVDGTLKNRMRTTHAQGNVHAKTGSISGVSTLSGYVRTADGRMLAFSFMANHFPGMITSLRNAQDTVMELLANFSEPNP